MLAVNYFIVDNDCDVVILTETWLRPGLLDQAVIAELCPPGNTCSHLPRQNGSGYGGLGIVFRENLNLKVDMSYPSTSRTFELMNVVLTSKSKCVNITVLYRPPPSRKNGFTAANFCSSLGT